MDLGGEKDGGPGVGQGRHRQIQGLGIKQEEKVKDRKKKKKEKDNIHPSIQGTGVNTLLKVVKQLLIQILVLGLHLLILKAQLPSYFKNIPDIDRRFSNSILNFYLRQLCPGIPFTRLHACMSLCVCV